MTTVVAKTRAVAGLLLALAWAGCASFSQGLAANKRTPGVLEGGSFKPALPPSENYGPNPKLTCQNTSVNSAVQGTLADHFKGKTVPEQEGRLCAVAETLLGWNAPNDDLPPEAVRAFLSSYFGLTLPIRQPIVTTLDSDDSRQLADPLAEPVATFGDDAKVPRYGLVTQRVKKEALTAGDIAQGKSNAGSKAVVVMQDQLFELNTPLPRQLPAGGTAQLDGHVLAPMAKVKTDIVDSSGKLTTVSSGVDAVKAPIACGKSGKVLVQVSGDRDGTDVQLADFFITCGGQLATSVKLPPAQAAAATPAQDEQRILELINAERAEAGETPLENLPALADISRKISDDRVKGKAVSSAQLMTAMREAEIGSPVILETAVQALNADDAFARLTTAAQDRSTLLNGEANQAGIGVAAGPMVGKIPTVIMTALLIKKVAPADPVAIRKALYEALEQRRKDAGAPPLARDPMLDAVAQKYAEAAAAGGGVVPPEKQSELLAPIYKESMTVSQVGGFLPDEKAAIDVAQQPVVVGNSKLVGVGVALGRSPQFGKNAPFVMAFFGTRHEAAKKAPAKGHKKK